MNWNMIHRHSIKTRVTLLTLVIFMLGIWALEYYASWILHEDVQRQLGEQQFSMASTLAREVNHELGARMEILEKAAGRVTPSMLGNAAAIQAFLDELLILQEPFNSGVIAYRLDGTAIAEVPLSGGRIGLNFIDRDDLAAALREGKSTIGKPHLSKKHKNPEFAMAMPIRDAHGKVIGAIRGEVNLGKPNFLYEITGGRYGRTGGYLLVAPQHRLIITSTDKRRVLEELPAPGKYPWIDRVNQGYEGTGVFVNPRGVEVLASVKGVPIAGWYLAAVLPTAEAFAPIHDMQQRMVLATAFLTLLVGGLMWWMLKRQFSPILTTLKTLANLSVVNDHPQPLPVIRHDEIGDLIGGFNRLLEALAQREEARKESEEHFRSLFMQSPIPMAINSKAGTYSNTGTIEAVNKKFTETFGYSLDDIPSPDDWWIRAYPDEAYRAKISEAWLNALNKCTQDGISVIPLEAHISCKDGSVRTVMVSGSSIGNHFMVTFSDITERKLAEQELRIAATAFETQEGIVVTDADNIIIRVNKAFSHLTGYSAEEAIGQNPSLLKSGRHNAQFYRDMWAALVKDQYWQGEIWNRRKNGEVLPEWLTITAVTNTKGQITNYVSAFSDITQNKKDEAEIHSLAFYDPLTGLPNRRLLLDHLQYALAASVRHGNHGAVLFIDLDNFKILNDTKGHNIGDLLLIEVAKRLQACVREVDTVARLGGDEFVIMLEELSEDPSQAATQTEAVGDKILAAISQPYELDGYEHLSSTSIGISLFREQEISVGELLKRADTAMYQAKSAGRNTLRFYDPAMQAALESRTALEKDLRNALSEKQLKLYYQMQVDHSRRIIGAEVLLRWQHPDRGLISPLEFIPLAETSGLILSIGQWVLETACTQLKLWEANPLTRDLQLAVNVSARQFRQADFVERVRLVLHNHALIPDRLKLELTESLVLDNIYDTISKMQALRGIGVRFSMDDFGTGYSSLSYLTQLPLDQLKIDQSFVRNIGTKSTDAVIVQTIIGMANNLGMEVIAEGVETEEQRAFLEQHGCTLCQGYLFGRPVPLDEFEARLTRI